MLSMVYTAVAMTLSAPANTSMATTTPAPTATPTVTLIPTYQLVTATTVQSMTSYTYYSTVNGCNDAIYVSDVTIPDGTVLAPGEVFTKTWEFQNIGSCAWDGDYSIIFSSGTDMDGETTTIDQEVSVNSVGDISVSLVAPDAEGTYVGYWRIADSSGNPFGESVYVMIVVSDSAATLTPTATSTSEVTSTLTSTPIAITNTQTSEPTATFTPTSTPQATDTFTPTVVAPTATPTDDGLATPTETSSG